MPKNEKSPATLIWPHFGLDDGIKCADERDVHELSMKTSHEQKSADDHPIRQILVNDQWVIYWSFFLFAWAWMVLNCSYEMMLGNSPAAC